MHRVPSLYVCALTESVAMSRGISMADDGAPASYSTQGLKHAGSRPSVCIESGASPASPLLSSPRPFVSHEYLNWILKAQNHRTNEPSPRHGSRDLDERLEFRGGPSERGDRSGMLSDHAARLEGNAVKKWQLSRVSERSRKNPRLGVSSRGIRNSAKDCGPSYPA